MTDCWFCSCGIQLILTGKSLVIVNFGIIYNICVLSPVKSQLQISR